MTEPFRGRTLAAATTLLALFATAACGESNEGAARPAESSSTAPADPSTPAEPAHRTTFKDVEPTIEPAVLDRFGPRGTSRAVSAALAFVHDFAYNDEIASLHAKKQRDDLKAALLAIEPRFTNDYAIEWRKDVEFALANGGQDSQSGTDIFVVTPFGYGDKKGKEVKVKGTTYAWLFEPLFVNPTVRSVVASYDPKAPAYINVRIKSFADARLAMDGAPALKRLTRKQNLFMLNERGAWKVWVGRSRYFQTKERPED